MATGDIGTILDTFTFDSTAATPCAIKVTDSVIAIAYTGPGYDGWIKTVGIDIAGNITDPVLDSFEYDGASSFNPQIIKISNNVFAVMYEGPSTDGYLKTIGISDAGIITAPVLGTIEFDTIRCFPPGGIVHVTGDIYALGYSGNNIYGYIKTIEIDNAGNITDPVLDTNTYTTWASHNSITHVTGDIYAISYMGSGSNGHIATVDIDNAGTISNVIDDFIFDSYIVDNQIINVASDMVAVVYVGSADTGHVVSIEIDNVGNITTPVKDNWSFHSWCYDVNVAHIASNVCAIVYKGPGSFGNLRTFKVINGTISSIDHLPHVNEIATRSHITYVSGNIYAITYQHSGRLKTVDIETPGAGGGYSSALPIFAKMLGV